MKRSPILVNLFERFKRTLTTYCVTYKLYNYNKVNCIHCIAYYAVYTQHILHNSKVQALTKYTPEDEPNNPFINVIIRPRVDGNKFLI